MEDLISSLKGSISALLKRLGIDASPDFVLSWLGAFIALAVIIILMTIVRKKRRAPKDRHIEFTECQYCRRLIMKGAMRCTHCGKPLMTAEEQASVIQKMKGQIKR